MGWFDDALGAITGAVGDVGLGDVLDAGSQVAGVLGDIGMSKNTQQALAQQGFGAMPREVQEYLMQDILPQIKELGGREYEGLPFKRADVDDYDPIFGSRARTALQDYFDQQAMPDIPSQSVPSIPPNGNGALAPSREAGGLAGLGDMSEGMRRVQIQRMMRDAAAAKGLQTPQGMAVPKGYDWAVEALLSGESGRVNPFSGATFDQGAALDALASGDLETAGRQAHAAVYDPTPSFWDKVEPLIGAGILALPTAGASLGLVGAAAPTLGSLGGIGITGADVLGAVKSGTDVLRGGR